MAADPLPGGRWGGLCNVNAVQNRVPRVDFSQGALEFCDPVEVAVTGQHLRNVVAVGDWLKVLGVDAHRVRAHVVRGLDAKGHSFVLRLQYEPVHLVFPARYPHHRVSAVHFSCPFAAVG